MNIFAKFYLFTMFKANYEPLTLYIKVYHSSMAIFIKNCILTLNKNTHVEFKLHTKKRYRAHAQKTVTYLHFNKSSKWDNIYKLCL